MAAFKSDRHRRLFDAVVSELPALGYDDSLVIRDYEFTDWFQPGDREGLCPSLPSVSCPPPIGLPASPSSSRTARPGRA